MNCLNNFGHIAPEAPDLKSLCPWIPEKKPYELTPIGLHQEIIDFCKWISPTDIECAIRASLIIRMKSVIQRLWKDAKVDVFGSFKSGLYLPTSDIDMCVTLSGEYNQVALQYKLESHFIKENICSNITTVANAAVPVIRATDRFTGYKLDICINCRNVKQSAALIRDYVKEYPPLPFLLAVIKQYLHKLDLNEVRKQGISSYSLVLMVVSFFQLRSRTVDWRKQKVNLGVLLIDFFELYGLRMNNRVCSINVTQGGFYTKMDFNHSHDDCPLSIKDPLDAHNDVGKSGYRNVREAFQDAYAYLTAIVCDEACERAGEYNKKYVDGKRPHRPQSFLKDIVRITQEDQSYRRFIKETYQSFAKRVVIPDFADPYFKPGESKSFEMYCNE